MKKRVFDDYTELFEGFCSGRLDGYVLIMDNDDCFLSYKGNGDEVDDYSDSDWWEHVEYMSERVEFWGGGCTDTIEILEAIGIPVVRWK